MTTPSTNVSAFGSTTSTTTTTKSSTSTGTLGKDDFLKLLMTQMQNQDPMNPTDNTQFVAQMAQFSSLEQMQNLNTNTAITQATNMIGKQVGWTDDSGKAQASVVDSIKIVSGQPQLQMADYAVVASTINNPKNLTPAAMVGTTVTWTDPTTNEVLSGAVTGSGTYTDKTTGKDIPYVTISGSLIDLSKVTAVTDAPKTTTTTS